VALRWFQRLYGEAVFCTYVPAGGARLTCWIFTAPAFDKGKFSEKTKTA
jgi:hypothetical protein